jgi:DegV family protein with EDD domain
MAERRTEVVCDGTGYLPADLVAERGLHIVDLYVSLDGDMRRESEITDYDEFYEQLRSSSGQVTTSQPSLGDFIEVYEPLLAQGKDIVSVHISAGLSGTSEAAEQARDRLAEEGKGGERIQVFDTRTAAGGTGLCTLAASTAAASGAGGEAVLEHLVEAREKLKIWFGLDTLEYLRRSGRIGRASGWLGTTLKIKPILTLEEEITPIERVRTRAKSLDRMRAYAHERLEAGADGWVVQYIRDREMADTLIEDCHEIFGHGPVFTSEVGPVLGAHAGPGMIGFGGVPASLVS